MVQRARWVRAGCSSPLAWAGDSLMRMAGRVLAGQLFQRQAVVSSRDGATL